MCVTSAKKLFLYKHLVQKWTIYYIIILNVFFLGVGSLINIRSCPVFFCSLSTDCTNYHWQETWTHTDFYRYLEVEKYKSNWRTQTSAKQVILWLTPKTTLQLVGCLMIKGHSPSEVKEHHQNWKLFILNRWLYSIKSIEMLRLFTNGRILCFLYYSLFKFKDCWDKLWVLM